MSKQFFLKNSLFLKSLSEEQKRSTNDDEVETMHAIATTVLLLQLADRTPRSASYNVTLTYVCTLPFDSMQ